MKTFDLRPLGIGEILDRAVTIFVRRFAVLLYVLAIVAIPLAIVQYAISPQTTSVFTELQRVLAHPGTSAAAQAEILRALSRSSGGPWLFVFLIAASMLWTLSKTACIVAAAESYRGVMPSVRNVYRIAFARWFTQIVLLLIYAALLFVAFIATLLVVLLATFAIGLLTVAGKLVATIVAVPLVIALVLGFIALIACLYLALSISQIAVALEDVNPIRAVEYGLRRTLTPSLFWRSLLVGIAVVAISTLGSMLLAGIGGTLAVLTGQAAFLPIVSVIGGLVINGLILTFVVIYTYDIRVRREGYDLLIAAREPGSSAPIA